MEINIPFTAFQWHSIQEMYWTKFSAIFSQTHLVPYVDLDKPKMPYLT
jgi:hypothetical protein